MVYTCTHISRFFRVHPFSALFAMISNSWLMNSRKFHTISYNSRRFQKQSYLFLKYRYLYFAQFSIGWVVEFHILGPRAQSHFVEQYLNMSILRYISVGNKTLPSTDEFKEAAKKLKRKFGKANLLQNVEIMGPIPRNNVTR